MNKLVWLIVFILHVSFNLKALNSWPPAYEIKADTASSIEIPDKYWQILEDPSRKLTINQVSSSAFDAKFHINNLRAKGYNYQVTNYWLRYTFKNTLSRPVKVAINETVAYAYLYTHKPDGTWQVQTTGSLVPVANRAGLKRVEDFVVTIAPGEAMEFYEKDIFDFWLDKPKSFVMHIGFADAVIEKSYINNEKSLTQLLFSAVILGILLMAGLINLLFYRVVKEKTYLFFAFFLFTIGFYEITTSILARYLIFKEHLYFFNLVRYSEITTFFFFLMHFIRNYLSTEKHTPKWDKFLIFFSWFIVVLMFGDVLLPVEINYKSFIGITIPLNLIFYSYMPIITFTMLFYLRINKEAKVGIIAMLPLMLWIGFAYSYRYVNVVLFELLKISPTKLYYWIHDSDEVVTLICFSCLIIVFLWILFKRYEDLQQRLIQTALDREIERGQLMEEQNEKLERQVEVRTAELKQSVDELKTTQQQLIQSEKLASLGELTAGIAHEIQNPLNFVNNFAEVNMELADEITEELINGDTNEAIDIISSIKQNLEKILHHGKRADGIVKGMLQHSRSSSNTREATDINKLADEYLRLAYHGLRAKDKSFNLEMETYFDASQPIIDIVPQDIGRVLLNLFTNAFYATQQKQKTAGSSYKPILQLTTRLKDKKGFNEIEIVVEDNGNGIPKDVKDKILEPFFTTKPTGEGTGLGLSISYDIVVKGHGGRIDIESIPGDFTVFTITLPITNSNQFV